MSRETARARQAWSDYLALGPDRSLEKLLQRYQSGTRAAPTTNMTRLKEWSRQFGWQDRLQAIIDEQIALTEAAEHARVRQILETGYAQAHERVALLKDLTDRLRWELIEDGRLWLTDLKGIGGGDNWREVQVERFNGAEVEQLRGLLDDLAKETGGRASTVKVDVESYIRRRAVELGLDPDEVVAEAQAILRNEPYRR